MACCYRSWWYRLIFSCTVSMSQNLIIFLLRFLSTLRRLLRSQHLMDRCLRWRYRSPIPMDRSTCKRFRCFGWKYCYSNLALRCCWFQWPPPKLRTSRRTWLGRSTLLEGIQRFCQQLQLLVQQSNLFVPIFYHRREFYRRVWRRVKRISHKFQDLELSSMGRKEFLLPMDHRFWLMSKPWRVFRQRSRKSFRGSKVFSKMCIFARRYQLQRKCKLWKPFRG